MSVSHKREEYLRYYPIWEKVRNAELGTESIKGAGERYLPKPNGIDEDDYAKYKKRAVYYNFVGRTCKGLKGMIFRKPPINKLPESMESYRDSITQDGKTITDFEADIVKELINPSRCGILLDAPEVDNNNLSIAEAEAMNIKPYLSLYKAESIINWRTSVINNVNQLSMCVLTEAVNEPNKNDKYKLDAYIQYRVLELIDGVYTVSIYRSKNADSKGEEFVRSYEPIFNGEKLAYIPFWILGASGIENDIIDKPILSDLADVNISHYVNSADNENALHWNGLPTIFVSGWPDDMALELGGAKGIPEGSTVTLIQPSAGGAITTAMIEKEKNMVALGANLITSSANTNSQTATSVLIQQQGETSIIGEIAQIVGRVMTEIMNVIADINNIEDDDIYCSLNVDFNPQRMSGSDAMALVQAWQAGAFDRNVLNYNLKQGEVIPSETDTEEMINNIKDEQSEREESLLQGSGIPE